MPLNTLLRAACILCIASVATPFNCYSQSLLKVDWQKVVCSDGYIDHVYSVCNDNEGNSYTLGSFENTANCLGQTVVEDSGHYFLTKQDANGEKVFAVNLGGPESFSFGDIKVCSNGDIVIGLCFQSHFFLNKAPIAYSSNWSNIILKLDQNLNLKWFKEFPANHNTYINKLVLDEDENIYGSILFLGSISIDGKNYGQTNGGYENAVVKLDSDGVVLWSHHYYSNGTVTNESLQYDSTARKIWIAGKVLSDHSIFVDGQLQDHQVSRTNNQHYISAISNNGEVLHTRFLDDDISQIVDIGFYQGRVFFAGEFIGVVSWDSSQLSPTDYSSICLGELDSMCELVGFTDLKSSKAFRLNGFAVTPRYGFVIAGSCSGDFSLQSSSINLSNQHGHSFLASIDDTLKLSDFKYIKGGFYNLLRLTVRDSLITGSALFEMNCDFENQSCFAWNDDISTFQTRAIRRLNSFNPSLFLKHPYVAPAKPFIPIPISARIYPNPFLRSFEVKFSAPVQTVSITVIDALGKVCKTVTIERVENKVLVDANDLAGGLYLIHCSTGNGLKTMYKMVKTGE